MIISLFVATAGYSTEDLLPVHTYKVFYTYRYANTYGCTYAYTLSPIALYTFLFSLQAYKKNTGQNGTLTQNTNMFLQLFYSRETKICFTCNRCLHIQPNKHGGPCTYSWADAYGCACTYGCVYTYAAQPHVSYICLLDVKCPLLTFVVLSVS